MLAALVWAQGVVQVSNTGEAGTAVRPDEGTSASVASALRALPVTAGYSTLPFSDEGSDAECDVADFDLTRCLSAFALVRGLERVTGIEPAWPAWKA